MICSEILDLIATSSLFSAIVAAILTFWFNGKLKAMEARIEEKMPYRQRLFTDKYTAYIHLSELIEDCRYEIKHTLQDLKKKEDIGKMSPIHFANLKNLFLRLEDGFSQYSILIDKDVYVNLHDYKDEVEGLIPYLAIAGTSEPEVFDRILKSVSLTNNRIQQKCMEISLQIKQRLEMPGIKIFTEPDHADS
jgi:hypothetical protein